MKHLLCCAGLAVVGGCVLGDELSGPALEARLSNSVVTFVQAGGPPEILELRLNANGTGIATEIKDPDEDPAVEMIGWRVEADALCLTPPEDSLIASTGQEECISLEISGDRVAVKGRSDYSGTIVPQ